MKETILPPEYLLKSNKRGIAANVLFIAAIILAFFGLSSAAYAVTFSDVTLGQAGSSALDLGIFVVGPTSINASNSSTYFNTNLGLAAGASTNFSGGGTLTGNLY